MEFPKDFGDEEECYSSTESGWTMYLCSPKPSNESDIYDYSYISKNIELEVEYQSDDSMASDASSGPIRYMKNVLEVKKIGGKCFPNKKPKYQEQEKEKNVYTTGKEAEVSVKSDGKVRKNNWFGKKKITS